MIMFRWMLITNVAVLLLISQNRLLTQGFVILEKPLSRSSSSSSSQLGVANHAGDYKKTSVLFEEFKMYSGEVVDPYKVLKVHRSAELAEIKLAYRKLSRQYHPDIVRHKRFLPGSCNTLDEARDQWERVKLAYEILSDRKRRLRYDRNEVLSDPQAALQRAAWDAVGNGIKGIGGGIGGIIVNTGKGVFGMLQHVHERVEQPRVTGDIKEDTTASDTSLF